MVGRKMIGEEERTRCPECGLILYQTVSQCPRCLAPISAAQAGPPMVERIYEPEVLERGPRERKDIKRIVAVIMVIVIVILLVLALSIHFIIPRIDLKLITVYKESTGLVVNLDSKVQNEGTLSIQHLKLNITVYNSTVGVVAKARYNLSDLEAHSSHSFDNVYFFGDQYENYHLVITVQFESEGNAFTEVYHHDVKEYMYYRFEDKFSQWGA
jgi:hypothetical protein